MLLRNGERECLGTLCNALPQCFNELEAFLDGELEQLGKFDGHVVNLLPEQGAQQHTFLGVTSHFASWRACLVRSCRYVAAR